MLEFKRIQKVWRRRIGPRPTSLGLVVIKIRSMYYVYILYSERSRKLYKGSTGDLKRRMGEHNRCEVKSTKSGAPWHLVYYEAFINKTDARREELFLKSGKGKERIKYLSENTLISWRRRIVVVVGLAWPPPTAGSRQRREELKNMYTVYIIRSQSMDRYYIGITSNLEQRLRYHNSGANKSTNKRGPWKIVHIEEFDNKKLAWLRERQIKKYKGGEAFKKIVCGGVA